MSTRLATRLLWTDSAHSVTKSASPHKEYVLNFEGVNTTEFIAEFQGRGETFMRAAP